MVPFASQRPVANKLLRMFREIVLTVACGGSRPLAPSMTEPLVRPPQCAVANLSGARGAVENVPSRRGGAVTGGPKRANADAELP
jgi:hypothetical protein